MKFPIFSIFIRSLFLENVWNYERMQNVGFTFSIIPFLKRLYKEDKSKLARRVKAHFSFFNTHPYMASIILGITAKLEEKCFNKEISEEEVIKNRNMLAGPIAAIGDRLIWSSWRVFCSILVCSYFLIYGKNFYNEADAFLGILIFLLVYNLIGHIPIRLMGLYYGYNYSYKIIEKISKFGPQKLVKIIRRIGIIILLVSSFIYSLSLIDDKINIFMFWINIVLSIVISKKFNWVLVAVSLFILNFLFYLVIK